MNKGKFSTFWIILWLIVMVALIVPELRPRPKIQLIPGIDLYIPDSGTNNPPKYCFRWVDDNPQSLRFYVMNKGTDTAVPSVARVTYDFQGSAKNQVQDIQVPEIPGGEQVRLSTPWYSQCARTCIIRLEVDTTNLVLEADEGNNSASCQDPSPFGYPDDW